MLSSQNLLPSDSFGRQVRMALLKKASLPIVAFSFLRFDGDWRYTELFSRSF
jgi:hypothetical protein